MRTSWLLIAAAAIVAGNYNAVSATSDVNQDNLVSPNNGHVKRFLRANKGLKDDEERVAPGTGLLDFTKTASLKTLDDLAADLAVIRGSSKFIKPLQAEKDWVMLKVAVRKWKPERVDEQQEKEKAKLNAMKPKDRKRKDTEEKEQKSKKFKTRDELLKRIEQVQLPDMDEQGNVPVYDDCDEIRKKINYFLGEKAVTKAAFLRALGDVNSNSLRNFMNLKLGVESM
ncbi:hypothetical protein PHMEG_00023749 [Phytophthora megakarya]|uniref:DUF7726 domain-containing protein n=1 Tax=Phytophthora megakarya TaxID=4795 RepID=A0A225VFM5_9STRA|nr:hypothetical protein PHMEG_00023749 [Phytophthora megakarya]